MNKNLSSLVGMILLSLFAVPLKAVPISFETATLEMHDPAGSPFGVMPVTGAVDMDAMTLTIDPFDFLGTPWTFTSINLYGPGSYSFNVDSQVPPGSTDPTSPGQLDMTVGYGQIGAFALFDWNVTSDIGLVMVWDVAYALSGNGMVFTAVDPDGDGVPGTPMIDGPFAGMSIEVNFSTPVPVPAAVWLFMSGLLGLVSLMRRKPR